MGAVPGRLGRSDGAIDVVDNAAVSDISRREAVEDRLITTTVISMLGRKRRVGGVGVCGRILGDDKRLWLHKRFGAVNGESKCD
jgi:hypothetical protein